MKVTKVSDPPVLTEEDLKRIMEESNRLYAEFQKRTSRMHEITPEMRWARVR